MRTFIARFLALSVLISMPFGASAANINLTNWQITASEGDSHQLDLAIEYLGSDEQATVNVSTPDATDDIESVVAPAPQPGDITINEFVSDPITGQDEWVELYNNTENEIHLTGWYLMEGSGKTTYLEGVISQEGYALANKPKGSLNNSGDLIQLYSPLDAWIDGIAYGNWEDATAPAVKDPFSVGRNASNNLIEMEPTPGEMNREPVVESEETSSADNAISTNDTSSTDDADVNIASTDDTDTATDTENTETNSTTTYDNSTTNDSSESAATTCSQEEHAQGSTDSNETNVSFVSLGDIRSYDVGTKLVTEGLVAVLPGILGKQYFYLAGSGVQVYLHSAEFPQLERGTRVQVTGELSQVQGEARLKASSTESFEILSQEDAPLPHNILSSEIGEETEGWLVRLTGVVTDKSSGSFMLADNDGEVRVVIKATTGIAMLADVEDEMTVTGVVSQTTSGYRLLPRDQQDLLIRSEETDEQPAAAGILSSNSGGGTAGWTLTGAALLAIIGSAGVYAYKNRGFTKPVTA